AYGEPHRPPVIASVMQNSPAARAGLAPGDRITEINGRNISNFQEIYPLVQDRPGMQLTVTYVREGREATAEMTPDIVVSKDRFGNEYRLGRIGLVPVAEEMVQDLSPAQSLISGVARTGAIIDRMATGIGQVITGRRSVAELGGPIKIAKVSGEAAELGWQPFIYLAALISINLGFINLLPVPMLDGGHLSFYAVEAIQRRPVSPRTMEIAFRSGMYALLALMLFVTMNDLASLGLWRLTGLGG
ncbi:MAG: RIP metalloprotease RseP, partial [Alphaproteobacteria bacterium]|nr:RIP metalloprotease RseP [Alphaproteobacteria bacterium]